MNQRVGLAIVLFIFLAGGVTCLYFYNDETSGKKRASESGNFGTAKVVKAFTRSSTKNIAYFLKLSAEKPVALNNYEMRVSRPDYLKSQSQETVQVMFDPKPPFSVYLVNGSAENMNLYIGLFLTVSSGLGLLLWALKWRS